VIHDIDAAHHAERKIEVLKIAFEKLEMRMTLQRSDMFDLAAAEVIGHNNLVPTLNQSLSEIGTDAARAACY